MPGAGEGFAVPGWKAAAALLACLRAKPRGRSRRSNYPRGFLGPWASSGNSAGEEMSFLGPLRHFEPCCFLPSSCGEAVALREGGILCESPGG